MIRPHFRFPRRMGRDGRRAAVDLCHRIPGWLR